MISGLLASRAGFLDSGTLPETYPKPFKSLSGSLNSGLVASELDFLILAPAQIYHETIKSIPESTISGLVASRAEFLNSDGLSETYQNLIKSWVPAGCLQGFYWASPGCLPSCL